MFYYIATFQTSHLNYLSDTKPQDYFAIIVRCVHSPSSPSMSPPRDHFPQHLPLHPGAEKATLFRRKSSLLSFLFFPGYPPT